MPRSNNKFTDRHKRFVSEYLIDLNGTQAAIRAGFAKKSAKVTAHRLLSDPFIVRQIQAAMDKRADQNLISADAVLKETANLAFSDPRRLFDANGNLIPIHTLPGNVARAIASIEVVTAKKPGKKSAKVVYTSKIKFWDKPQTLALLGKHLKIFVDRVEHQIGPSAQDLAKLSPAELEQYEALMVKLAGRQ